MPHAADMQSQAWGSQAAAGTKHGHGFPAHAHLSRDGAYARGRGGPRSITVAVATEAEAMQQSQLWARGRAPHGSSPRTHGGRLACLCSICTSINSADFSVTGIADTWIKNFVSVVSSLSHDLLFCDPVDCSPPGSSVHSISQARILEWVVIPFPRDLPDPGIEPTAPALAGRYFTTVPSGKPSNFVSKLVQDNKMYVDIARVNFSGSKQPRELLELFSEFRISDFEYSHSIAKQISTSLEIKIQCGSCI